MRISSLILPLVLKIFFRNEVPQQQLTRYKVGQYVVFPTEFENLVLPLFKVIYSIFFFCFLDDH